MVFHTRWRSRFALALAGAVTAVFVLTGCGENEDLEAPPEAAPAAPPEEAEEPEDTASDGLPSLDAVNEAEQTECLPGNWYPHLDEWAALYGEGLQGTVEISTGNFVLMIDDTLKVTKEFFPLEYLVTVGDTQIPVSEFGEVTWQLEMADDGAVAVHGSLNDANYHAQADVGDETHTEAPAPTVFDFAKMQCAGDELTVHNPHGTMSLGREH